MLSFAHVSKWRKTRCTWWCLVYPFPLSEIENDGNQPMEDVCPDKVSNRKWRKSYTIQKKLDAMAMYEKLDGNVSSTAKALGIPRSCVQNSRETLLSMESW